MPTVYLETYGCQMNVADTDMVLGLLEQAGYARTLDPAGADVILINTCAVRERAVERVRGRGSAFQPAAPSGPGCLTDLRVTPHNPQGPGPTNSEEPRKAGGWRAS